MNFVRRAINVYATTNRWLTGRPHAVCLILLAFGTLFALYTVYDFATDRPSNGVLAATCAVLADLGAGYELVRFMRGISAGHDGAR